jgi:decaprenylphospho-beta-D-erythro-pentofuranosid-2-ulose 2-reductase
VNDVKRADGAKGARKTALILGANSDVAKEAMQLWVEKGYQVIAASRTLTGVDDFIAARGIPAGQVITLHFDATAFADHAAFYAALPAKPHIVLYAAGFQVTNDQALVDWAGTYRMVNTHYAGAVSILNLVAMDGGNPNLERIIGLSSLSGVRGRKSNFVYGSTKAAFSTYLAGLRQLLGPRGVVVNAVVAGYIRTKMTAHLDLPESLLLEPAFIARAIVNAGNRFVLVPGFKWKLIYQVLRLMPESMVARLP